MALAFRITTGSLLQSAGRPSRVLSACPEPWRVTSTLSASRREASPRPAAPFGPLERRVDATTLRSHPSDTSAQALEDARPGLPPPLLSVAPMMDWTDVHFRQLARMLSRHAWLYTEMVVDQTILHQRPNLDRFLAFPGRQHPLVLQLGGNNPEALAAATDLAAQYSYDEININCGCPSEAVSGHGCFGARLMLDPQRVAAIALAMAQRLPGTPITVKCRIGVDDFDSYHHLYNFVRVVSEGAPVTHFVIHARKALLKGLSPAENRTVPPLKYEFVLALMRDFPHLAFSLNGGIVTLHQAAAALSHGVHGVMIGRAAYNMPWQILASADTFLYGAESNPVESRRQLLEEYSAYADASMNMFGPGRPNVQALVKPLLGLFHGEKGGARFRRAIDACVRKAKSPTDVIEAAMAVLPPEVLDAGPPSPGEEQDPLPLGLLPDPPSAQLQQAAPLLRVTPKPQVLKTAQMIAGM